jgi:carboxypeptidase T
MKNISVGTRLVNFLLIFIILISTSTTVLAKGQAAAPAPDGSPATPVVARVYFANGDDLNRLASTLDIWEVNHEAGYLVALLSPARYASLQQAGYRVIIDQAKTDLLNKPLVPLPGQGTDSIPGYPCYRTVDETYFSMQLLQSSYSYLVDLIDIGDSWDKVTPGGPAGYDLYALRITNEAKGDPDNKPTFFIMAEIHAREYTTAETAMRFAEYLTSNYGSNPDVTWLLDYFRVFIVPMTNPDGRTWAETGEIWRKNTNNIAGGGCTFPDYGIDLNRNHSFHWGGAGTYPCEETYQGPSAGSEPETMAIQNFVSSIFPDQKGPGDAEPAPVDTTGTFITLHSYAQVTIFPWGWTTAHAPNFTQLQTLGRKLGFLNQYEVCQSGLSTCMYNTTGTSDDWAYGNLGIAAYTIEMGNAFFESCSYFESNTYPANKPALLYAFKTARRPYMNPSGPDSINLSLTENNIPAGTPVQLTALADDTRYDSNGWGTEPTQNISQARYSIDAPSWITGTLTYPMSASDGSFSGKTENIQATLDTSGLTNGRHTIFVESQDMDGNWGVPGAIFLDIVASAPEAEFASNSPVLMGEPVNFDNQTSGSNPRTYAWDFGDGLGTSSLQDPIYVYASVGTFTVTLVATNTLGVDNITHTVTVEPVAIASVDLTRVTLSPITRGEMVDFSADLFPEGIGAPYSYTINLGDGTLITGTSAIDDPLLFSHVYNHAGLFTLEIQVLNSSMAVPVTDTLTVKVEYMFFLPLTKK